MNVYERFVLPRLLDLAMRNKEVSRYREKVVPAARGQVLEVGVGSGLNLGFYGPAVERLVGVDPSEELLEMAKGRVAKAPFAVELLARSGEHLPMPDASFDSVVTTFTLCTIPDAAAALREMRRVLKPSGQLLFAEHGVAPDEGVRRWQHRLNPVWRRLAGGCNLDRDMPALIQAAGFRLVDMDVGYAKGPKPMAYMYSGVAKAA